MDWISASNWVIVGVNASGDVAFNKAVTAA